MLQSVSTKVQHTTLHTYVYTEYVLVQNDLYLVVAKKNTSGSDRRTHKSDRQSGDDVPGPGSSTISTPRSGRAWLPRGTAVVERRRLQRQPIPPAQIDENKGVDKGCWAQK